VTDFEPSPPGDDVDPNELEETDFSEFESQVVEQFNAREAQSSATPDETPVDASPSPGSEAAVPSTGGAALDFVEPVDDYSETSEPEPQQETVWTGYDDSQQQMARGVFDWYQKLDQTAVATVDAALSGDYVLVPAEQIETLQQNWDQLHAPQQERINEEEYGQYGDVDPEDPLVQEMMELKNKVEFFEQQQINSQINETVEQQAQIIDDTFQYWCSQHSYLEPSDMLKAQEWVLNSGVFETFASQYDSQTATLRSLDQALFTDPQLRMKAVQPMIDQRLQEEMQAAQEQAMRGMRASAVSGSSGTEPDMSALNPEEAMIEEIRRSLEGL